VSAAFRSLPSQLSAIATKPEWGDHGSHGSQTGHRDVSSSRDVSGRLQRRESKQTNALQLNLEVDRDIASSLGVSLQAVDGALYDAFGQRQVATMYTQLNQYRVVLEAEPELAGQPGVLDNMYVRSLGGAQIPLSALSHWTPSRTSLSISHQGQFPAVTLSFNLAPEKSLSQALDAIHGAEARIGLPAGVVASPQGTAKAFVDSLSNQPILILAALLAVYIVLGVLYESLVHPVTILSTLPSAGVGALLALMLMHTEFSIIALIGVILLIGIVKKNAIMMIDFALQAEREQGLSTRDAIFHACLLRFRPIMMTTMAALLGGLPLALGHGNRLRDAASARHCHRGRFAAVADADPVHHAGGLPDAGSVFAQETEGQDRVAESRPATTG